MKRALAGILWFCAGWYAGSMVAWIVSVDGILAPVVAIVAAGFIVADPRHVIWTARPSKPASIKASAEPA